MKNRCAFTLVELLVVIAVLAVLAMAMTPLFRRSRENGDAAKCKARLKGLWQATLNYVNDTAGERSGTIVHTWMGCFPYAGSYEITDILGKFHQRTGWVKWTVRDWKSPPNADYFASDGYGCDETQAKFLAYPVWSSQQGTTKIEKLAADSTSHADAAIRTGSIFQYTLQDPSIYCCPKFKRNNKSAVRSYTMNYWFGSRRLPRWDPINILQLADVHRKEASRLLLFTEMPYATSTTIPRNGSRDCYSATDQVNIGEESGKQKTTALGADECFDFDADNNSAEVFGAIHRVGGKNIGHAAFVDGHIESLDQALDYIGDPREGELSKKVGNGTL